MFIYIYSDDVMIDLTPEVQDCTFVYSDNK